MIARRGFNISNVKYNNISGAKYDSFISFNHENMHERRF